MEMDGMDVEMAAANPTTVKERIDEALHDLAHLAEAERSRSEIMEGLARDLSEYYGYIEDLAEFLLELFPPAECVEYMEASDRPRPLVIRTNTLKTARKDLIDALTKRGAAVEPVEWSKVAVKVTESTVPIGATPEYLAGHYMLQSAASMNPVMALAPQPGERVLDMSAAPGGKTSYIAQLMKNSGTIIANDLKPQRQKATIANLHRLGVKNSIVCCYDGRKIGNVFKGFDRVLLDAPCSGLGVISRDQSVKVQRTVKDIQRVAHLQKELLRAAVDAVDPKSPTGGIIVYSTCSISTEENEQVVDFILQKRFVKLIDTGLQVGKPGFTRHKERRFHPSLTLTRRFYPHVHNMDGFYVAKFKKFANGVRSEGSDDEKDDDDMDRSTDEEDGEEGQEDEEDGEEEVEDDSGNNSGENEEMSSEEAEIDAFATRLAQQLKDGATGSEFGDDLSDDDEGEEEEEEEEEEDEEDEEDPNDDSVSAPIVAPAVNSMKKTRRDSRSADSSSSKKTSDTAEGPAQVPVHKVKVAEKQPKTAEKQPKTAEKQPKTAEKQPKTAEKQPKTAEKQPKTAEKQPRKTPAKGTCVPEEPLISTTVTKTGSAVKVKEVASAKSSQQNGSAAVAAAANASDGDSDSDSDFVPDDAEADIGTGGGGGGDEAAKRKEFLAKLLMGAMQQQESTAPATKKRRSIKSLREMMKKRKQEI